MENVTRALGRSARASLRRVGTALGLAASAGMFNGCTQQIPPVNPHPSAVCAAWLKAQGPLVKLGIEALRLGRIDAGVYSVDPSSGRLRLADAMGSESSEGTAGLGAALDSVNGGAAGAVLAEAQSRLSQGTLPSQCPPAHYSVKVTEDPPDANKPVVYHWTFSGDAPTDEQLKSCFLALYAPEPQECTSLPLFDIRHGSGQESYSVDPDRMFKCGGCSAGTQHGKGNSSECNPC